MNIWTNCGNITHLISAMITLNSFSEAESIGFNLWKPIVVRIFQSGPE